MITASLANSANSILLPKSLPDDFTAVFMGATSGIGRSTLKQLVRASKGLPVKFYIIGRNANAAVEKLAELRRLNPEATIIFIEKNVSLVRSTEEIATIISQKETKIDLLSLSMGFLAFGGREDTTEGLDPSMATGYYSKVQAVNTLLPLLNASKNPHVLAILAGGQEGALTVDDLDLRKPGNYSFAKAAVHNGSMLTLMFERFAASYPNISFVHSFPGLVATPILTRGGKGFLSSFMKWVVSPVINALFAEKVEDAGAKALFYATNEVFTVAGNSALATPVPEGFSKSRQTSAGLFLVGQKGEAAGDEKFLNTLRAHSDSVLRHTNEIFNGLNMPVLAVQ